MDDAIAKLNTLAGTPVEDHPAVLEEVHGRLGEILARLDGQSLDEEQR